MKRETVLVNLWFDNDQTLYKAKIWWLRNTRKPTERGLQKYVLSKCATGCPDLDASEARNIQWGALLESWVSDVAAWSEEDFKFALLN